MNVLLSSSLQSFFQLLGVLIIFAFVLAITYLTTRWLGGYTKAHTYNKNLQIIESIHVGNNKLISIVAVGHRYFVVSVGKDEVHMLGEVSEEDLLELPDSTSVKMPQESFQEILSKIKGKFPNK